MATVLPRSLTIALLATCLARLPGQDGILLDYAAGVAEDQIKDLNFQTTDTFTWTKRSSPARIILRVVWFQRTI